MHIDIKHEGKKKKRKKKKIDSALGKIERMGGANLEIAEGW